MPNRVPRTYDEIVRKTVPDPDSSWRPTPQQERQAYAGFRALDAQEQALSESVDDALIVCGHDRSHVTFEVDRDRVTLRGSVRNHEALKCVVEAVSAVPGISEVVDRLVIAD